jgi:hypothetical protein
MESTIIAKEVGFKLIKRIGHLRDYLLIHVYLKYQIC